MKKMNFLILFINMRYHIILKVFSKIENKSKLVLEIYFLFKMIKYN